MPQEGNAGQQSGSENTATQNVDTSQSQSQGSSQAGEQTQSQAPRGPHTLTDDDLVNWEGAKEPVKFGNLRGLQSQFTKISQKNARYEAELKAERARVQQYEQALRQQNGNGGRQAQPDPFEKIKALPYLTGEEAVGVSQQIMGEISRRDQILTVMAQRIQQQDRILQNLNRSHTGQSFNAKINSVLNDLGLDPEYIDDAKAFYLAHEGEDLDEEFPEMYKKHVEKRRAIDARLAQKQREAARNKPFVPGKGGRSATTGELNFAGKSAKEQADMLWDSLQSEKS